jgi:hypothetical protein
VFSLGASGDVWKDLYVGTGTFVNVVINNSLLQDAGKNVEAALETYEGKYIIHLPEGFSNSINLLHETGHILFDFVKEGVLANVEFITNAANLNYSSVEEYFCASFVDYIHRKDIDPLLTQDLSSSRDIKSLTDFDILFKNILYSETKVDVKEIIKRLDFVNKILEQLEYQKVVVKTEVKEELQKEKLITQVETEDLKDNKQSFSNIPSTDKSTWDAVYKLGDKVRYRKDMVGLTPKKMAYESDENIFIIKEVGKPNKWGKRTENPTGVMYSLNSQNGTYAGSLEGKDIEPAF